MKPIVYIASPYTKGDQAINVRTQLEAFDTLMKWGTVTPVAPLMSHFQQIFSPLPYQTWLDYDLEILSRCDALLRIDSEYPLGGSDYKITESSGADGEVVFAEKNGIPVFYSFLCLYEWVENEAKK